MTKSLFKKYLKFIGIGAFVLFLGAVIWLFNLDRQIQERISKGWFKPPIELYAAPERIFPQQSLSSSELVGWLKSWHFRERGEGDSIHSGDFAELPIKSCEEIIGDDADLDPAEKCVIYNNRGLNLASFTADNNVVSTYSGLPLKKTSAVYLPPQLFAQFYAGIPILRKVVGIGEIPLQCLQAVTAVEDSQFLEHSGVSFTGILRAAGRNFLAGRYAQGGSTITQQLVKNYFLTSERSIKRKIIEAAMALLLETRASKDQILNTYLNIVYLGQNGPFQIIGFHSASEFFFNKDLSNLNLSECALLAAVINSPGRYNPLVHPAAAKLRRDFVLKRMTEVGDIPEDVAKQAGEFPLPQKRKERLGEPAPYFTQAVFRELTELGIDNSEGLKVYTTLNERAQEVAQMATRKHIDNLESSFKSLQNLKKSGKPLEGSLVTVDLFSGGVSALVGGRLYKSTQFNRVLDARRQVGSIMKPFIYLAALEGVDPEGKAYSPLTIVDDSPMTHKYEGQTWSPQNYDSFYMGPVPLFVALKNSLNSAAVKVGLNIGISNVIDVARRAGVKSEMQSFPSLMLGSFEIRPWEIAESYSTIARMGKRKALYTIQRVESLNGSPIYNHTAGFKAEFAPQPVAKLVSMMEQTVRSGSARLAPARGFLHPAAGKTGTTSDTRDAWFAGFTSNVLAVTWIGYDDNTPSGLTGASGALPLWIDFMKQYAVEFPPDDFPVPEGLERKFISPEKIRKLCPKCRPHELIDTYLVD
jgi:penicillin-binding protein 1B